MLFRSSAPGIGRERMEELPSLMVDARASWGFIFDGVPATAAPLALPWLMSLGALPILLSLRSLSEEEVLRFEEVLRWKRLLIV